MTQNAQITGRIKRQRVNLGSKSERMAVLIEHPDGTWLELRDAANPRFQDDDLPVALDLQITVTGRQDGQYFFYETLAVAKGDEGET